MICLVSSVIQHMRDKKVRCVMLNAHRKIMKPLILVLTVLYLSSCGSSDNGSQTGSIVGENVSVDDILRDDLSNAGFLPSASILLSTSGALMSASGELIDSIATEGDSNSGGPIGPVTPGETTIDTGGIPIGTIDRPRPPDIQWSMEERYGLGYEAYNEGLYDASYVYPEGWGINVDVCDKANNANGRVFNWSLVSEDGSWDTTMQTVTCAIEGQIRLPVLTKYTLSVEVQDIQAGSTVYTLPIEPKDLLIVTMGDSIASGEGRNDFYDVQCNKSRTAGYAEAARRIEERDPHTSVTYLMLACSGASLIDGVLLPKLEFGPASGCIGELVQNSRGELVCDWARPGISQLQDLLMYVCDHRRPVCTEEPRTIDMVFIQAGANDLAWADYLMFCAGVQVEFDLDFIDDISVECFDEADVFQLSGEALDLYQGYSLIDEFLDGQGDGLISDIAVQRRNPIYSGTKNENPRRFMICAFGSEARIVQSGYDCNGIEAAGRSASSLDALKVNDVYLGEYAYELFLDGMRNFGGCEVFSLIDPTEAENLYRGGEQLSLTYRNISEFMRWSFVEGINEKFKYHGYCSGDTWWEQVIEISEILDASVFDNVHAFVHPTVQGHQAITDETVEAVLRSKPSKDEKYKITLELANASVSTEPHPNALAQPVEDFTVNGGVNKRGSGASLNKQYTYRRGEVLDITDSDASAEFTATIDDRLTFSAKMRQRTPIAEQVAPSPNDFCFNNPSNTQICNSSPETPQFSGGQIGRIIIEIYSYSVQDLINGVDDSRCVDSTSAVEIARPGISRRYTCTYSKFENESGFMATYVISVTDRPAIVTSPEQIVSGYSNSKF